MLHYFSVQTINRLVKGIPKVQAANLSSQTKPYSLLIICLILTACSAVTHGFSMFLYSALLPEVRAFFQLSYSTASFISALLFIAYMLTSLISGVLLTKLGGYKLFLFTIGLTPILLVLAVLSPWALGFAICLAFVSGCAVANWNAIVALSSDIIPLKYRNRILGLASSGAAFAITLNGILIALFLPELSLQSFWFVCAGITTVIALLSFMYLPKPEDSHQEQSYNKPSIRPNVIIKSHPVALQAVLLSGFIGCISGPFLTFLSPFIVDVLKGDSNQTGSIWTMIGVAGIVGGIIIGSLADKFGILNVIKFTLLSFALSIMTLLWDAKLWVLWSAASIFAFLYFPVWGLIASHISQFVDSKQGALIVSLGMVGYGCGNAFASSVCGILLDLSSQYSQVNGFTLVYGWILSWAFIAAFWCQKMQQKSD
jgi:predicted MFS family arabinose efflux permease